MTSRPPLPLLCLMVFSLAGVLPGCQEAEKPTVTLTQQQWKEVKTHILSAEPDPTYKVGAHFGQEIELIGFDVTEPLVAGKEATFTWYWRAKKKTTKNWRVFVHLDSQTGPVRQGLDHHPVGELYQTSRWEPGQIIRDVQQVQIRPDYPQGEAIPYVGLYLESGSGERLPIVNDVPKTEDQRAITATLKVRNAGAQAPAPQAAPPLPKATLPRAPQGATITVDGKLDEEVWGSAATMGLIPFGGQELGTVAKMTWDEEALYIGATLEDEHVWGTLKDRDSDTWTQEVFEVFLDTNGDGSDYLELQLTPANVVFDARFAQQLGAQDRQAQIDKARAWTMEGLQTAVAVQGTLNVQEDKDTGWTLEMKLPFASIPGAVGPPKQGETWSLNLYRFDRPAPDKTYAYAWSTAPQGDFHQVSKFGTVEFVRPAPPAPKDPTPAPTTPTP